MLRLILLSDRIIGGKPPSAYSKVGHELCVHSVELGHKVAHIPIGRSNNMGKLPYRGILIYESGWEPFAEDVAISHYIDFKADMLICLKEAWNFQKIPQWAINFVPYTPIDHSPVSASLTSKMHTALHILVPSKFGQRELKKKDINSIYMPHGVSTEIYKPLENKSACKKAFYLPEDDFTVLYVGLNRARKMIPQMLRGYKRFLELNPDVKSHFMLWTNVMPETYPEEVSLGVADVGVSLLPEIYELGLGEACRWPSWEEVKKIGGLPEWDPTGGWDMVKLYNMADVNSLCTGGEGAGMTGLEAAACGVSSVVTNYAAAHEYAGPTCIPVNANDYVVINTPGTRYMLPSVDEMSEALTKIYNADREKLAKRARMHALKYNWDDVIKNFWAPFLEECEVELCPKISREGLSSWAKER